MRLYQTRNKASNGVGDHCEVPSQRAGPQGEHGSQQVTPEARGEERAGRDMEEWEQSTQPGQDVGSQVRQQPGRKSDPGPDTQEAEGCLLSGTKSASECGLTMEEERPDFTFPFPGYLILTDTEALRMSQPV